MTTPNAAKTAWNPSGIAWLAFFFSFFPAGILYAFNYSRLGKPQLKWPFIIGVTTAFILLLISLFVSDNLNEKFFQFLNIIAALLFYSGQKTAFHKFLQEGGKKASFKLPILYSFIFTALLIAGGYGLYRLETKPLTLVNNHFENEYIAATIPAGWNVYKNEPGDATLIVYLEKENGIANISIDHDENFVSIPNSITIKNHRPADILDDRLKSLEESTKEDPNSGWKNFRRAGGIKETSFKGLPSAEGEFIVDENILGAKEKTERKIKRMVIFTHNDLFNVVFAATDASKFVGEEKEFNQFMNSLIIK